MAKTPKVGWLLKVLLFACVALSLGQAGVLWAAAENVDTAPRILLVFIFSFLILLPLIPAWLLWRWSLERVQFLRIRIALGEEYTKARLDTFTVVAGLVTALGTLGLFVPLSLMLAVESRTPWFGWSVLSFAFQPIWSIPSIFLIATSRYAVLRRRVQALREEHLERKLGIVDKCEAYCRESKNVKTRVSRARLGSETLPALVALDPKTEQRAEGLELYFSAVERGAELVESVQKLDTIQTERSKAHYRERTRELLAESAIRDEDLVLLDLRNPENSSQQLTLEKLRELVAPNEDEVQPSSEPEVEPQSTMPLSIHSTRIPLATGGPARWVAAGELVQVQGFVLKGGMLYVGCGLTAIGSESKPEPAAIDPELRLDPTSPARAGKGVPYWPVYADLTPKQRAAYLEWLAEERTSAGAYIGYVFLFFYGLERRLAFDLELTSESAPEWIAIRAEVSRLTELYGANKSFDGYARSFSAWIDFQLAAKGNSADKSIEREVIVAELARAKQPVSAKLAFEWAISGETFKLRAPAQRCPDEFRELFELRYSQLHGDGIVPRAGRARVRIEHKPASPSFSKALVFELDLPDISHDADFMAKLAELLERASEELAPYSRKVQRGADLAAIGLLPRELARTRGGEDARDLVSLCEAALGNSDEGHFEAKLLHRFFPPARGSKLSKAEAVRAAQVLDRFGFGIEPDVRFGAPTPREETKFELFRLALDAPQSPSAEYASAISLVQLTAAVVAADGELLSSEELHFEQRIEETLSLDANERTRLRAHLRWRARERPSLAGLKKRIEGLTKEQREAAAQFLISIAASDGRVSASELGVLGKIYALLGIDEQRVHADLHGLSLDSEPVTRDSSGEFELDEALIDRKHRETLAVSKLLSDIFDEESEAPVEAQAPAADGVAGLDAAHSALLRSLRARDSWTRAEFESLSSAAGLLPDGALETLNECAFERFDSPLTEGEDPIEVIHETVQEFLK